MKYLKKTLFVTLFAMLFSVLPASAQVKAASDKPVLEVTVTDEKSGTATISGIDIPKTSTTNLTTKQFDIISKQLK